MDNNQIARQIEREINERDFTVLHRSSEADGEHGMKNKCDCCGKFRPWDDLIWTGNEDEEWSECVYCCSDSELEHHNKQRKVKQ